MRQLFHGLVAAGLKTSTGKWLVLGCLVGVACGIVGLLFYWATEAGSMALLDYMVGYRYTVPAGELPVTATDSHQDHGQVDGSSLRWWLLLIFLVLGGLVSGLIVQYVSRAAAGAGTGAALEAFHRDQGNIRLRTVVAKFFATTATFSTGGSAGREGPIALIGAGLASTLGKYLHLSSRDRRVLLMAGVAGGVAALFRAPLAGAFFAAEVLYRDPDVESDGLIPCFISAIVAYVTFGITFLLVFPEVATDQGFLAPLFATPVLQFRLGAVGHLVGYTLVAVSVALVCRGNVGLFGFVERSFRRLPGPFFLRPMCGALGTGVVALVLIYSIWWSGLWPSSDASALAVLSSGYGVLQQGLDGIEAFAGGHVTITQVVVVLLLIAGGKMLTSSLTVGSGGSGGLFGPSLVVGGCVGAAIGFAMQDFEAIAPSVAACLIMGMVGFLAAGYRTPVAALLMISEMTGSYSMLLPGMWVCTIAYLLGGHGGLAHGQVRSPLESPAHRGHFFSDILAGIRVDRVFDAKRVVRTLKPSSSIDECKDLVTQTHQSVYPVVDDEQRLCGIFSLNDLRMFLYDETLGLVAVAQDVATTEVTTIGLDDSLATALRRFTERNLEELPVVDADGVFLGLLTRRQAIACYNETVEAIRAQRVAEGYEDEANTTRAVKK